MNYKRILLGILFSPIIVPCAVIVLLVLGFVFGIEYVLTGEVNKNDGGW